MTKKYEQLIGEDGEVRELTEDDFLRFKPLRDSFPDLAEYSCQRKAERPKSDTAKQLQSFKLSPDVIEGIRRSGAGYNGRVEAVLRAALQDGRI